MPLTVRPQDELCNDGSTNDPSTLTYDRRFEAEGQDVTNFKLAWPQSNIEDAIASTCVIVEKEDLAGEPAWSYEFVDGRWILHYDRTSEKVALSGPKQTVFWASRKSAIDDKNVANRKGLMAAIKGLDRSRELEELMTDLVYPPPNELVPRFKASLDQAILGVGSGSAYYLGDGIIGTAGHCVLETIMNNPTSAIAFFNWKGDNINQQTFVGYEVERVILNDTHRPLDAEQPSLVYPAAVAEFSARWDAALLKIKLPTGDSGPRPLSLSFLPPKFGQSIYGIGSPNGLPLKVSPDGHVIRHSVGKTDIDPISRAIDQGGTYSVSLDVFSGNSGGPYINAETGQVVGHASGDFEDPFISDASFHDIRAYADRCLNVTRNYSNAKLINTILEEVKDYKNNLNMRVYPAYLRVFPRYAITCVLPEEIGPNGVGNYGPAAQPYAVYTRQLWNSRLVYQHNLAGRVDRNALFLTPLNVLRQQDNPYHVSSVRLILRVRFQPTDPAPTPDESTTVTLRDTVTSVPTVITVQATDINPNDNNQYLIDVPIPSLAAVVQESRAGLSLIQSVTFQQSITTKGSPFEVGLLLIIGRRAFPFPVALDKTGRLAFPPGHRPDLGDSHIMWESETFKYINCGTFKVSEPLTSPETPNIWVANLTSWTNPGQPPPKLHGEDMVPDSMRTAIPSVGV